MVHRTFRPDLLMVESVAAQAFVVQHLQRGPPTSTSPVLHHRQRVGPPVLGVEALCGCDGDGALGVPGAREHSDRELRHRPRPPHRGGSLLTGKHTDDYLMAKWFAEMALRSLATTGGASRSSPSPEVHGRSSKGAASCRCDGTNDRLGSGAAEAGTGAAYCHPYAPERQHVLACHVQAQLVLEAALLARAPFLPRRSRCGHLGAPGDGAWEVSAASYLHARATRADRRGDARIVSSAPAAARHGPSRSSRRFAGAAKWAPSSVTFRPSGC